MWTPTDPPGRDRPCELPELDRPPAACAPTAPDPEASARLLVGGALVALALLTMGSFIGGVGPMIATLISAAVGVVVTMRLLPARYRGHACLAGYTVVVFAVLLG